VETVVLAVIAHAMVRRSAENAANSLQAPQSIVPMVVVGAVV